ELTQVVYTTAASSKGGRDGHVTSADGVIDLDLATPGRAGVPKANPETLFAAGYAACFQNALLKRARTKGVDTSDSTVTAAVSLGEVETGGFGLAVELTVEIPGVDQVTAQELAELAHQYCPYSNATRGNIDVTVRAV
ncbi:MAG: lipoyl-dependent peroxiredoxin, partial [Pseudonocardiales bacterium]|nr:lipoyl-dependent peroxiredoxin [Pseudonocardiales bacterium]